MTPQERDVIGGIFDRLRQAADQPREPEAERYIAERLREQPYAPYAMAQAIYVQEQALANLQAQLEETQGRLRQVERRAAEPAAPSGGFLSGIFGGGSAGRGSVPSFPPRAQDAPAPSQPSSAWSNRSAVAGGQPGQAEERPAPGPWTNQAQGAQGQPGRGGGFMATALSTAAGVAGGMMLGNILTNAFGSKPGGEAQAAANPAAANPAASETPAQDGAANAQPASDTTNYDDGSSNAANYQQAAHEEPVHDDFDGFDDGGGDDWA